MVAAVILLGQILIVQVAYPVFNIRPLNFGTWLFIVGSTSLVLVAGEVVHFAHKLKK